MFFEKKSPPTFHTRHLYLPSLVSHIVNIRRLRLVFDVEHSESSFVWRQFPDVISLIFSHVNVSNGTCMWMIETGSFSLMENFGRNQLSISGNEKRKIRFLFFLFCDSRFRRSRFYLSLDKNYLFLSFGFLERMKKGWTGEGGEATFQFYAILMCLNAQRPSLVLDVRKCIFFLYFTLSHKSSG